MNMKLFAIHAPIGPAVLAGLEGARAARTGFSFAALVFGPLWLLARGLWLALGGYIVLAALVAGLVGYGWLSPGAALALIALAELYLGLEPFAEVPSVLRSLREAGFRTAILSNGTAKASADVDEALNFLRGEGDEHGNLTEIDEAKLVHKIDMYIMPLLFMVYYLQYTDKTLGKFWNRCCS